MGVKLPIPLAPFQQLDVHGESIAIDGLWDTIVLPTGHPYLLPNCNEYTLTPTRTLPVGTNIFTDDFDSETGLQNLCYPWIVVYDNSLEYVDLYYFTQRPTKLQYVVCGIVYTELLLDADGKMLLDGVGKYILGAGINHKITSLILYPGNGSIFYGRFTYPDFNTCSNYSPAGAAFPPDFLSENIGSVVNFLKPYGCINGKLGSESLLDGNGSMLLDADGKYLFSLINSKDNIIDVDEFNIISTIPDNFVGFGIETQRVCDFVQCASSFPRVIQLFKNLGTSVIRFGGSSSDGAVWVPDGVAQCNSTGLYSRFTRNLINNIFSVVAQTGWKAIWSTNLIASDVELYSDEVAYVKSVAGDSLLGIEISNEPDCYTLLNLRAEPYTPTDYMQEWEIYYNAIHAMGIDVIGPDTTNVDWLSAFVNENSNSVSFLTFHWWPTVRGGSGDVIPTIENLLSQYTMKKAHDYFQNAIDIAGDTPISIGETQSTLAGGQLGLSNTVTAALWAIDYMFTALELGINSMYFQGAISPNAYTSIDLQGVPHPLYYAVLFFHHAAENGNCIKCNVSCPHANIAGHAVIGNDGILRVSIINKDIFSTAEVTISTKINYSHANALFLKAQRLDSTNVTFGSSSVLDDGTWTPTYIPITINGNSLHVSIPIASAVLLTLT